jgi:sulfate transport system ATP-binding protein
VFVTHDQEEAMEVADTVVVMNAGHVEQVGTPEEVYHHPGNPFVYHFLGNVNLFHGRDAGRCGSDLEIDLPEYAGLSTSGGGLRAPLTISRWDLTAEGEGRSPRSRARSGLGPSVRVELTRSDTGDLIEAHLSRERQAELALKAGERVYVRPFNVRVFLGRRSLKGGRGSCRSTRGRRDAACHEEVASGGSRAQQADRYWARRRSALPKTTSGRHARFAGQ